MTPTAKPKVAVPGRSTVVTGKTASSTSGLTKNAKGKKENIVFLIIILYSKNVWF